MATPASLLTIKDLKENIAIPGEKPQNPISPLLCPTQPFTRSTVAGCQALLILGAPESVPKREEQRIMDTNRGLHIRTEGYG